MKKPAFILIFLLTAASAWAQPQTIPLNLQAVNHNEQPINPSLENHGVDAVNIPPVAPIIDEEDLNFDDHVDAFGDAVSPSLLDNQNSSALIPFQNEKQTIKVDTRQSLTDNIKKNAPKEMPQLEVPEAPKTWVNQLITSAQNKDDKNSNKNNPLAAALEQSKNMNRRSNASVFDISGVMLRMSYPQAESALIKRGYKKTMQKMDIPNFIRWRNEEKCRNQGVIGYERLNNCVVKLANKENYQFIAQAQFSKFDTKETVQIFLTSTFTNNKVYKITYHSEAANNTGNSTKAMYLRNIKVYDFWKKINQKYGVPDNKEDVIWSLGGNKPYMRAATGYLVLEDSVLRELDYTRMSREDQRYMNTDLYTF